ncbi:hypothetical protein [Novosphingobium cyanobacteriorum]|uniref:Zinc ribbon domain-containing protein n=1 Tax=Novosphingobium cyanobacteriorum TaxID=3024215 RepID=A0ABT6CNI1_9SPHN|nr:hypothetical protein [Novosphingobium cyanobacteriorum]MDF8335089.1 hypothetical protein [Novosphingobium cyanobacteriorum]
MILEALVVWLVCAFAAALIASAKGRSSCGFAFLAFILGPLGLIVAALASPDQEELTRRSLRNGTLRKCPRCAEAIKREALACRFCGCDMALFHEERTWLERVADRLAGI